MLWCLLTAVAAPFVGVALCALTLWAALTGRLRVDKPERGQWTIEYRRDKDWGKPCE
jgi:hypothetical protein